MRYEKICGRLLSSPPNESAATLGVPAVHRNFARKTIHPEARIGLSKRIFHVQAEVFVSGKIFKTKLGCFLLQVKPATEEQPEPIFKPRCQCEKAQSEVQHPFAKRNLGVSLFGYDMDMSNG
ncbi:MULTISPECIES: hypothetical protein [Bacteroidales]|uniref:hypothetical protein n=1 Tax=Bacteroidales TaxID=171549 RepID=UPI001F189419|nr:MULTISPECIES: hypothetical protein [Bacteroidales]MCE9460198.1 hypothetical protein [Bacteroides caccae]MDB9033125.1 hypothetical protein [Parabacteroides distasonis]